jgi:polyhydroxyalkanoate synthase subunit PhaE
MPIEPDPWRQWQQALAAFGAPGSGSPGASHAAGSFAPFIDAAERFASATRSFRDAAAGNAGISAPAAQAAAETFGNFLRDQFADFFKVPWAGVGAASALGTQSAGDVIGQLPALGLTREHQERAQRAAQALGKMADAQRRLQRLWSDTLREAASTYVGRLGAAASAPLTSDAINGLYDSWIDCAEEAYARTAHSEPFCDALADYVNGESQWRRESNAGAELWAKLLDLPTRHEINTLAERLRALEDELRALANSRPASAAKPRRAAKRKPQ